MRQVFTFAFIISAVLVCAGQPPKMPLSQREACERLRSAVVRIDAGGQSRGTGFIASPDGFVLTAAHVIVNPEDGRNFYTIYVTLPSGVQAEAKVVPALTVDDAGEDFVLLKVDTKTPLPYLTLGSVEDVVLGADATIIGFPFSAISPQDKPILSKFCLNASFTAEDEITRTVTGMTKTRTRAVPFKKDVKVDVVYFQGPSVKGLSGSPIIARDTGRVVGIVTTKLTGIGASLMALEKETRMGVGGGVTISGLNPGAAFNNVITVLDNQLSNGLGSATGIDDPGFAVKEAERKLKTQKH
jgi:Trypsin-like peptidase domain